MCNLPAAYHLMVRTILLLDRRLGDPLSTSVDRFCWDWWYVPGQYTLLRTPAEAFFPADLYDQLEDALIAYGERELGCRGISPIWLRWGLGEGCWWTGGQAWVRWHGRWCL